MSDKAVRNLCWAMVISAVIIACGYASQDYDVICKGEGSCIIEKD